MESKQFGNFRFFLFFFTLIFLRLESSRCTDNYCDLKFPNKETNFWKILEMEQSHGTLLLIHNLQFRVANFSVHFFWCEYLWIGCFLISLSIFSS